MKTEETTVRSRLFHLTTTTPASGIFPLLSTHWCTAGCNSQEWWEAGSREIPSGVTHRPSSLPWASLEWQRMLWSLWAHSFCLSREKGFTLYWKKRWRPELISSLRQYLHFSGINETNVSELVHAQYRKAFVFFPSTVLRLLWDPGRILECGQKSTWM